MGISKMFQRPCTHWVPFNIGDIPSTQDIFWFLVVNY